MDRTPTARSTLRRATTSHHERVDAAFAQFDLGDPTGYKTFLQAQATALLSAEAGVDGCRLEAVLGDWTVRRRSPQLIADLAAMGVACDLPADAPAFDTVEAGLGAVYVLEGSRLGGRLLARSVPEGWPRSFLNAGDPALWRELVAVLDATLISASKMTAAIDAACAVFARFEASAQWHLKGLL